MKRFWVFLVSLLLSPILHAAELDLFESKALAFSIRKPSSWVFAEANSKYDNSSLKDGELNESLKARRPLPLVVIRKYREPYDGLNPSLQVIASSLPSENLKATDLLKQTAELLKNNLEAFRITKEVKDAKIAGPGWATLEATYTTIGPDKKKYDVKIRYWISVRGTIAFTVGATTLKEPVNYNELEIQDIIKSVSLTL